MLSVSVTALPASSQYHTIIKYYTYIHVGSLDLVSVTTLPLFFGKAVYAYEGIGIVRQLITVSKISITIGVVLDSALGKQNEETRRCLESDFP